MATEAEVERMVVRLMGDGSSYQKMLQQAQSQTQQFQTGIQGGGQSTLDVMAKMGMALAGIGVVAQGVMTAIQGIISVFQQATSAAQSMVSLAAEAEQTQISFATMLQSEDKANKLIDDIRTMAAKTPLGINDIQQSAKMLLQFGIEGEKLIPIMGKLSDVTGGNATKFGQMTYAFAQMSSTGRLMGGDLMQMVNAGFNPLQEMSRTTGKSMAVLKKQMEAGQITTKMVTDAFVSATAAGGRFAGMTEKQADSLQGLWSTFNDGITGVLRDMGDILIKGLDLKGWLKTAIEVIDKFALNFRANMWIIIRWGQRQWENFTNFISYRFGWLTGRIQQVWEYIQNNGMKMLKNLAGFFFNFSDNIKILWNWLGNNWQILLQDMLTLWVTVQNNMAQNVAVALQTLFRLWVAFQGWQKGLWDRMFSFEFIDALLTGLIRAGEEIRKWAVAVAPMVAKAMLGIVDIEGWEQFRFGGNEALKQIKEDFDNGAKNLNFFETATDIMKEQMGKFKNPIDGWVSKLKDMPELKLALKGLDLPAFVWEDAKDAGEEMKNGFDTGAKGMGLGAKHGMKAAAEAVGFYSAEALQHLDEYRAGKTALIVSSGAAAQPKAQQTPQEKFLDKIATGISRLVELGIQDRNNPKIDFETVNLA